MSKTGILLHVYHLDCDGWERLVWGEPAHGNLGVGTKLLESLLTTIPNEEVKVVLYSGPSTKNGLSEGEYTYRFLLDRLDRMTEFPQLRTKYNELSPEAVKIFNERVSKITLGKEIENTYDEILHAADEFQAWGADRVIHIAAASHAPRCIQLQAAVREAGLIPAGQQWFTVSSDLSFAGRSARDTVVIEPPHRPDDPLIGFEPTIASVLRGYVALPPDDKKRFIRSSSTILKDILKAAQSGENLASESLRAT